MPPLNGTHGHGKEYWRSLDELADTPEFREFMHNEFPASASAMLESGERRQFLKVMGASMAFAGFGLAGCRRWPEEHIVPYASRPVDRMPGVPEFFATSMELGGVAVPLLATSSDGRPTKLEGNPDHPASRGASSAWAQASILDMYDPDRSTGVRQGGQSSTWSNFAAWMNDRLKVVAANRGQGLAILSEATSSPSVEALRATFASKFPSARWHTFEPLNNDHELQGSVSAFGQARRVHLDFSRASVIVSFDSDFLCHHPDALRHTRDFAKGRRYDEGGRMSRLYCFDGGFSLTGANADHRVAMKRSHIGAAVAWMHAKHAGADVLAFERMLPEDAKLVLEAALVDLQSAQGRSVIIAGPEQPADVHVLVHALNHSFGNVGQTVQYTAVGQAKGHVQSLVELVEAMNAGQVSTLIMLGGNPVYNAPADLAFAEAMKKVEQSVHLSDYVDETSAAAQWHINRAHALESWGDGRSYDGTYTLQQPLIEPLFNGRTSTEVLALLVGDSVTSAQEIVKRTFSQVSGSQDIKAWRKAVHDGFVSNSAARPVAGAVTSQQADKARQSLASWAATGGATADGWEVVFTPDSKVYDGRFANNGWLQELPDPLTKLTWDNAAIIGIEDAEALGVRQGDLLSITVDGRTKEIPALLMPAMPRQTISVSLGYGREMDGRICAGAGVNAYQFRGTSAMWFAANADVRRGSGRYPLACTQDHHAIDTTNTGGKGVQSRLPMLFQEATLENYRSHGKHAFHGAHVVHTLSLFQEQQPFHRGGQGAAHAWAMAVDLNACTGCSACVVACQAENNIPVVGKDQVLRGREMHWIRIDRYFRFRKTGSRSWDRNQLAAVALQPVMCMHCENAPCEQVCPVAATVHDQDGLNVMVYNRCVGTRYCSNNCPYKVRRFNYFDYHRREAHREQPGMLLQVDPEYYTKRQADPGSLRALQFNPEVTVRNRGVMEKCTYCIQRINAAKIEAKNAWARQPLSKKQADDRYPISDGTITPACAQACPAEAMVFGDLKDTTSRVHKLQNENKRAYELLEELNVKARTKYLAKLRNTREGLEREDHHEAGAGH